MIIDTGAADGLGGYRVERPIGWLTLVLSIVIIFFLGAMGPARAQQVEPMVFSLTPSGSGATRTLRMDNTRSAAITVETAVNAIVIAADGSETWAPAEDEFQIFPPQSLIPPGRSQAFRVRYVGDPSITQSKAYRVSLRQLPVDLAEGESGIAVGLNFNTLVNVVPAASRSELVVSEIAPSGPDAWTALVENRGSRYARLTRTVWRFETPGRETIERTGAEVFGDIERNLMPPGASRRLTIPRPPDIPADGVAITIDAPPTE